MALQELKVNKLRTFLSLFGITIGIFCIIGVLATIDSLKTKISNDLSGLGNNTIFIDKWDYNGGPEYPWWKFVKRPSMKIDEMDFLQKRSSLASNIAFFVSTTIFSFSHFLLINASPDIFLQALNVHVLFKTIFMLCCSILLLFLRVTG